MAENMLDVDLVIGERVKDETETYKGTVRWIGKIAKSPQPEATWIGVEWDDPTRGKYDGSIYGDRYFTCPKGAGSFVRMAKLRKGRTLLSAIDRKYAPDQRPHIRVHCPEFLQRDKESGAFTRLINMDMSDWDIHHINPDIVDTLPNLRQLSLADNLLADWQHIHRVLANLTKLEHLNVNQNDFSKSEIPEKNPPETGTEQKATTPPITHQCLQTLTVCDCNTNWKAVNWLLSYTPALTELHFAGNRFIPTCDLDCGLVKNLKCLNLSWNGICSWKEVSRLSKLPHLDTLLLRHCPLAKIDREVDDLPVDGSPEADQYFPSLATLSLDKALVDNWQFFDNLSCLKALRTLNIADVPLFDNLDEQLRRKLTIATVTKITKLNRSKITDEERDGAERYFVRYNSQNANPPASYYRLKEKHGDLQPLADVSLAPPTQCGVAVLYEEEVVQHFEVDRGWQLWEFKVALAEHLGTGCGADLEVWHKTPYSFDKLKYMELALHAFRIHDTDEIHVRRASGPSHHKMKKRSPAKKPSVIQQQ